MLLRACWLQFFFFLIPLNYKMTFCKHFRQQEGQLCKPLTCSALLVGYKLFCCHFTKCQLKTCKEKTKRERNRKGQILYPVQCLSQRPLLQEKPKTPSVLHCISRALRCAPRRPPPYSLPPFLPLNSASDEGRVKPNCIFPINPGVPLWELFSFCLQDRTSSITGYYHSDGGVVKSAVRSLGHKWICILYPGNKNHMKKCVSS